MTKQCCKYHDNMMFEDSDLTECGASGKGRPTVCCDKCPDSLYPNSLPIYFSDMANPPKSPSMPQSENRR